MDIYLLREQKEVGPYAPDEIRSWMQEGYVVPHELAWTPGYENWVPLETILQPETPAPAFDDEATVKPQHAYVPPPRANAKQKAFLSYMGTSFSPDLTEEEANHLIQKVSKDPKLTARRGRWENDRLDLHPEMFAEEVQARRANRPAYFHKLVTTEGGDCFTGVTKAHCQVLVQYLDVNHPRWDAHLRDATWHFFFPAIAEKFPQLVHKEWRPKLKFKEAPRVASELLETQERAPRGGSRSAGKGRLLMRVLFVSLLLGALGAGVYGWLHPAAVPPIVREKLALWGEQFNALVRGDEPASAKKPALTKTAEVPEAKPDPVIAARAEPPSADGQPAESKPAGSAPSEPTEAKPETDAAPAALPKPTEGLFNPNANAEPPAPAAPAASKTDARITKPIQIQGKYGTLVINAGTLLKIISHEGDTVTVNYLGQPVRVPVSSTDFQ